MRYIQAMKWRIGSRRIWLPGVYSRLAVLFFSLSLLALYFYLIGNTQGFTDATLHFLLRVESWILILSFLTAVFAVLSHVVLTPFRRGFKVGRILFPVLGALLSMLLYLLVTLLQAFMTSFD